MAAQEQNKVCTKCFEVNDPAATFCIECGAPLSDDPTAEGSDQEVYREITQANLHRIRGDYKEAIDVCLGILKRFPNNKPEAIVDWLYASTLSRLPTTDEKAVAIELLGYPPTEQGVEDLVWAVIMLPEFQLVR